MNFMVLLHDEKRKVVLLDIKNEDEHHYIVASRFDDKADWNKRYFQCIPYYEPEALQEALDEYRRQTEPEYINRNRLEDIVIRTLAELRETDADTFLDFINGDLRLDQCEREHFRIDTETEE